MISNQDGTLLKIIIKLFHKIHLFSLMEFIVFQIMVQAAIQTMGQIVIFQQEICALLQME